MALLETPVADHGFIAPDFSLRNIDGRMVSLSDVRGTHGTVVMFICNHCPYVKAVIDRLVDDCKILQANGIGCVAIMSNDTQNYPADSFENMKVFAQQNGFTFPYVIDETQDIARAFGAVCTPDIFGFSADDRLQYRGRVDSAGPQPATGDTVRELRSAMLSVAETGASSAQQFPSMGCSIKWR